MGSVDAAATGAAGAPAPDWFTVAGVAVGVSVDVGVAVAITDSTGVGAGVAVSTGDAAGVGAGWLAVTSGVPDTVGSGGPAAFCEQARAPHATNSANKVRAMFISFPMITLS